MLKNAQQLDPAALSDMDWPPDILISRDFDAPRRLVYQAWTDPRRLEQWLRGCAFIKAPPASGETNGRATSPGPRHHAPVETLSSADADVRRLCTLIESVPSRRLEYVCFTLDEDERPSLELLTTVTFQTVNRKTRVALRARLLAAQDLPPQAPPAARAIRRPTRRAQTRRERAR
jgi:uncharacterized protein YndB with AHSA1/START domain